MTHHLDKRLQTGLESVTFSDKHSPFTQSLLEACSVYFDGRLRLRNWLYPLFKPKHPALIMAFQTMKPHTSFDEALDSARWMMTGTLINLYVHHLIIEKLKAPLVRLGVWSQFATRWHTQTYSELEPLREFVKFDPSLAASLAVGNLPDDEAFCEEWEHYMDRHGHRAENELDLAVPRLRETPAKMMAMVLKEKHSTPPLSPLGWLMFPLGWYVNQRLDARDRFLFHAMIGFQSLRRQLLNLAQQAVERGQLESPDAIWNMDLESLRRLDTQP